MRFVFMPFLQQDVQQHGQKDIEQIFDRSLLLFGYYFIIVSHELMHNCIIHNLKEHGGVFACVDYQVISLPRYQGFFFSWRRKD